MPANNTIARSAVSRKTDNVSADDAIRSALIDGDYHEAVERCACEYGDAVGRLCTALVGSFDDAQELAQDTFIAAYKAFHSYRSEGSIRAFLFGIARHLCARHVETRTRRETKLRLVHFADAPTTDTHELLAKKQTAERAREVLSVLRPSERDALVLRFHRGLCFREVAEACGVDEPTARKRVGRAIVRLRSIIDDADAGLESGRRVGRALPQGKRLNTTGGRSHD